MAKKHRRSAGHKQRRSTGSTVPAGRPLPTAAAGGPPAAGLAPGADESPAAALDRMQHLAQTAEAQGDWPAAQSAWSRLRDAFPEHWPAYAGIARGLRQQGRVEELEDHLVEAAARFPQIDWFVFELAANAARRRDWIAAEARWRKALSLNDAVWWAHTGLAEALREQGRSAEAEAVLVAAQNGLPNEGGPFAEHARLSELAKDWPEAERRWAAFRQKFPDLPRGYTGASLALRHQGRPAEAEALLREAVERLPDAPDVLHDLARLAEAREHWAEAEAWWSRFATESPQIWWAHAGLASALNRQGRCEEAEAALRAAQERFADEPHLFAEYARLAEIRRDWTKAEQRWAVVRDRFPHLWVAHTGAAVALCEQKRFEEAKAVLTNALRLFPEEIAVRHEAARMAERRGDWTEAAEHWNSAVALAPDLAWHHLPLASALRRLGRLSEAEAMLLEAQRRLPDEPAAFIGYAECAEQQRQSPEAERRWRAVRARFPLLWAGYGGAIAGLWAQMRTEEANALVDQWVILNQPPLEEQEYAMTIETADAAPGAAAAATVTLPTRIFCELGREFFCGGRFAFERTDGTALCKRLGLNEDGTILGHNHPNEQSWDVLGTCLVFRNAAGEPTTVFDRIEIRDGVMILLGRFTKGDTREYMHRLVNLQSAQVKPASVVSSEPVAVANTNSVAVLVRTHMVDEKFNDLMRKLDTGREHFDVYPIVDETRGRPDIDHDKVVWHSVDACRELGLTQPHPALLWYCSDFGFYFALRALPDYKHYIMIEYDVDLTRPDASFFNDLALKLASPEWEDLDFAGLAFGKMGSQSGWYAACCKVFQDKYCYNTYFPVTLMSKRAAAFLFSQRQVEALRQPEPDDIVHCEAYAASCAMAGGFRCADFNEVIPGCYEVPTMGMQLENFEGLGKPMGVSVPVKPEIQMIHPVYGHAEYMERIYRKYILGGANRNDWKGLLRQLESPDAAVVSEELKSKLRSRAPAELV